MHPSDSDGLSYAIGLTGAWLRVNDQYVGTLYVYLRDAGLRICTLTDSAAFLVSPDEEALYTRYIDEILHSVDLETVTRKKIRAELEEKLGGKDLSTQKVSHLQAPVP